MNKALLIAFTFLAASSSASFAQDARAACRADAQKYCASAIGNTDKVLACLKTNQDKISDSCKSAIAKR